MHAVHAVGLRGVAPVAEAVESDELEPGGEHLDGEDRRRHRPPELTLHGRAVSARAGPILGGGEQARAWRQSAEPVPRVGEPGAEEQPDVWGVARAEERDSPRAPLRRGRLPGRRHGRRESRGCDGRSAKRRRRAIRATFVAAVATRTRGSPRAGSTRAPAAYRSARSRGTAGAIHRAGWP